MANTLQRSARADRDWVAQPEAAGADSARAVSWWTALAVLALIGGLAPVALAWHFGALGIPRHDDWSYVLAAFRFADHGQFNGNGWVSMNLVGQLVVSFPVVRLLGDRIAGLQVEVAALGVVGLFAVFDLAKQVISPRRALLVAVMVAVGPMWASLSASYMTDVPAFALAMVCLALGARAFGHDDLNVRLFAAALLVGFLAFTVREYAIVAPLAVALAGLWASGGWPRRRLPLLRDAIVGLVAIAALFLVWRRGLPGSLLDSPKVPGESAAKSALRTYAQSAALLGVLVFPAVLLAGPRRIVRAARQRAPRASIAIAVGLVLFLGAELVGQRTSGKFLGPGDYVLPNGSLGIVSLPGTRADLFPRPVFAILALLGIVSAVLFVLAALPASMNTFARVRRGRLGTPASPALAVVTLAAVGYGLTCTLPVLFGLPFFDRYLLPLVPLIGVLVIRAGATAAATRRVRLVSGVALLVLAIVGAVYATNAASFDGTKWRVAEQAASVAGSPRRVDGGFEWNDFHAGKDVWFVAASQRRAADFCIALRAESRAPGDAGDGRVVRAARVWGPTSGPVWIVARQQRAC